MTAQLHFSFSYSLVLHHRHSGQLRKEGKIKKSQILSLHIQSANAWFMGRVNISGISERAMIYLMNCETGTSAYSQDFHLKGTKFWSYMLSLGRLRLWGTDYKSDSLIYLFC